MNVDKKVIFELSDCEENDLDIKLIVHRRRIYNGMHELSEYCRKLNKYEERNAIPIEEIINNINEIILNDYYNLFEEQRCDIWQE